MSGGKESPTDDIRIGEITAKWAENNHVYVAYQKSTESTNDTAKDEAFEEALMAEALCLYVTDHQTHGRGRGQNLWDEGAGGGALLSSWSYLVGGKPQPTLSCMAGLALYRAASATWPFLPWNLKAPNDLYIADKKVAGLLIENVSKEDETRLIVGLGLNVFSRPKMATAISLAESLPEGVPLLGQDWSSFLDRFLFELTDAVSHCEEPLTPTDQYSLLMALNFHPLLKEKYQSVDADGSLTFISGKKSHWSQL